MNKKLMIEIGGAVFALVLAVCACFAINELGASIKIDLAESEVHVEYGEAYEKPSVHAYVNKPVFHNGAKDLEVNTEGDVDVTKLGTYEITYSACYKKKQCVAVQQVKVEDTKAPTITLLGDAEITLNAGDNYEEAGYQATDNYDGDITANTTVSGEVNTATLGDYTLTYTVKDSSENTAEISRVIHVVDTIAPEITLAGRKNYNLLVGQNYSEPGYQAVDALDGDITDKVSVSGNVDVNTVGTYELTYTVADAAGNQSSVIRVVKVQNAYSFPSVPPGDRVIYLTFDDGPGPYTQRLLDILDQYGVKATFFVTNMRSDYQYMIGEEARRGHTVAIHSLTHNYSQIYSSVDSFIWDMNAMNDIITAQTGAPSSILRFPGGASNTVSRHYCSGVMSSLVNEVQSRGIQYCDWNVSSGDAGGTTSTQQVVQNVINGCSRQNVAIVLQHDIKGFSVDAVGQIIEWGLANGYTFKAMDETTPMVHQGVNN